MSLLLLVLILSSSLTHYPFVVVLSSLILLQISGSICCLLSLSVFFCWLPWLLFTWLFGFHWLGWLLLCWPFFRALWWLFLLLLLILFCLVILDLFLVLLLINLVHHSLLLLHLILLRVICLLLLLTHHVHVCGLAHFARFLKTLGWPISLLLVLLGHAKWVLVEVVVGADLVFDSDVFHVEDFGSRQDVGVFDGGLANLLISDGVVNC